MAILTLESLGHDHDRQQKQARIKAIVTLEHWSDLTNASFGFGYRTMYMCNVHIVKAAAWK